MNDQDFKEWLETLNIKKYLQIFIKNDILINEAINAKIKELEVRPPFAA